ARRAVEKMVGVGEWQGDRQLLLDALAAHGFNCVMAENGDEAIAKAQSELPDLILMDIIMPGTNGYEATRAITRGERTKGIPVIICTGKDGSTDRLWGLRQGAKDYITKPVDERELMLKIAALS